MDLEDNGIEGGVGGATFEEAPLVLLRRDGTDPGGGRITLGESFALPTMFNFSWPSQDQSLPANSNPPPRLFESNDKCVDKGEEAAEGVSAAATAAAVMEICWSDRVACKS